MAKRTTNPSIQSPGADANGDSTDLTHVLAIAIKKLTSQILLFLIAYAILLVIVALRAPAMSVELRVALCLIPVLGVAGYVVVERNRLSKAAESRGISVRAGIAAGEANLVGVRGGDAPPGNVNVRAGIAMGKANLVGLDHGSASDSSADEAEFIKVFRRLGDAQRREILSDARLALDKQEARARRNKP